MHNCLDMWIMFPLNSFQQLSINGYIYDCLYIHPATHAFIPPGRVMVRLEIISSKLKLYLLY